MKIILIVLFVLYLGKFLLNRRVIAKEVAEAKENAERTAKENAEKTIKEYEKAERTAKEYEKATQEYEEATQNLYETVEQTLGQDKLQDLKRKKVWIGMPECLMYYVCGEPQKIEQNNKPEMVEKTWCYDAIPNVRNNAKKKYEKLYYSQNGFITWYDLNETL